MAVILRYFSESAALEANYVKNVVEVMPLLSATKNIAQRI